VKLKFIERLVLLFVGFCFFTCCSYASMQKTQFNSLYCCEGKIPEIDSPWKGKIVLDSCNKGFNRMAICCNTSGQKFILESSMDDSFFDAATTGKITPNDCRKGCVYTSYNHDNIITMLNVLFLRLGYIVDRPLSLDTRNIDNEIRYIQKLYDDCVNHLDEYKLRKKLVSYLSIGEDLQDMYNFQAAMMTVSQKNYDDLNNNLGAYVQAAKKFVNRLIRYITYCPQITINNQQRERHSFKELSIRSLNAILTRIAKYEEKGDQFEKAGKDVVYALAYITHQYPPREDLINLDANLMIRKIGNSQLKDTTSDNIKKLKRYIGAISHTEVMYYVLKCCNSIGDNDGKIIVSGKCPCPDCDIFITSNEVKAKFFNCAMIGYAYGWAAQDPVSDKPSYKLECTQLAPPQKLATNITLPHADHVGNTPCSKKN